jgi:hypothetical protein
MALSSRSLISNTISMPAVTLPNSHNPAIDEVRSQINREARLLLAMR